jgi:CPA2 family monovalent cation:H+ antiporter-2
LDSTAPAIFEIGFVLLVAAIAGWLARRAGLPAVLGYLATGLLVSPFTPGYVADRDQITFLADVGVVLLLFEVGIEVDLVRIRREARSLLAIAPLQVVLTTAIGWAAFAATGSPPLGAALLGLSVALSSSVVVVNITRSRRRTTDRDTEQALLGWSVVQDVAGVSIAAIILAVFGVNGRSAAEALSGLVVFALLAIGAAWLLPVVLRRLRGEHDLFLIVSVASGLTLAAVGSVLFGIPMALAAFVAGLAIGEGHDAAEARRRLLPFRDLFAVLFFVALGSLLNPAALPAALPYLALFLGLVAVSKTIPVWGLARLVRLPARPIQLALGLSQVGEFGFVLASVGVSAEVVSREHFTAVIATVVLTTAGSAILARLMSGSRPAGTPDGEADVAPGLEPGPAAEPGPA